MGGKMMAGPARVLILAAACVAPATLQGCREIVDYQDGTVPGTQTPIIWERTAGLTGESILSLRVDQNGVLYAGTESGRLYRSITDGNDWSPIPLPYSGGELTTIVTDQLHRLFVANDTHGIVESTDGGATWFSLNAGLEDSSIYALALLPGGALIAGSARGDLTVSGGGTALWTKRFSLARPVTYLLVLSTDEIYAATWSTGIYRFAQGDSTAQSVNSGLQDLYVNVLHAGGAGYLFAGTRNSGLYRSDPGNIFWQNAGGGSISRAVIALRTSQYGELFAGTATGIFYSTDAGGHWTKLDAGIGSREVGALAINENARVFAGTADGVWRSIRVN